MPEILDPESSNPLHVVGEDEILDLVDEHDQVIGVTNQQNVYDGFRHKLMGYFVRKAGLLLINDGGDLWIPRRQPWKLLAPDGYDFSADEHVHAGEKRSHAAARGALEELSLPVDSSDLVLVTTLSPSETGTVYFSKIYAYHHNEAPVNYSRQDYIGGEWIGRSALLAILSQQGVKQKATLAASILALPDQPQRIFS